MCLEHAFLCHLLLGTIAPPPFISMPKFPENSSDSLYFPCLPKVPYSGCVLYILFLFCQTLCWTRGVLWLKGSWDLYQGSRGWIRNECLLATERLLQSLPPKAQTLFSPHSGKYMPKLKFWGRGAERQNHRDGGRVEDGGSGQSGSPKPAAWCLSPN